MRTADSMMARPQVVEGVLHEGRSGQIWKNESANILTRFFLSSGRWENKKSGLWSTSEDWWRLRNREAGTTMMKRRSSWAGAKSCSNVSDISLECEQWPGVLFVQEFWESTPYLLRLFIGAECTFRHSVGCYMSLLERLSKPQFRRGGLRNILGLCAVVIPPRRRGCWILLVSRGIEG